MNLELFKQGLVTYLMKQTLWGFSSGDQLKRNISPCLSCLISQTHAHTSVLCHITTLILYFITLGIFHFIFFLSVCLFFTVFSVAVYILSLWLFPLLINLLLQLVPYTFACLFTSLKMHSLIRLIICFPAQISTFCIILIIYI